VAQPAGAAGELPVDDFADEFRLDPVGSGGVLPRRCLDERVPAPLERFEAAEQAGAFGFGEAGADVADVDQFAGVGVVPAEQ
jgi:hypothetical protein